MDKSATLSNRIHLECTRYYTRRLASHARQLRRENPQDEEPMDIMSFTTSVENIVSAYLNRTRNVEFKSGLVQLAAPFVWTLKTEAGMYFCFERLMGKIEEYSNEKPLPVRISFFLTLFRQFLPDLYNYFEEEAVDTRELASTWLQWLFAKEMGIEMLMRLWGTPPTFSIVAATFAELARRADVYFSSPDLLELHNYVCLAILTTCKESLEELDQSEIRSMLLSLPTMDVDRLVMEASNLRLAYRHSQTRGERPAADY